MIDHLIAFQWWAVELDQQTSINGRWANDRGRHSRNLLAESVTPARHATRRSSRDQFPLEVAGRHAIFGPAPRNGKSALLPVIVATGYSHVREDGFR